MGQIAQIRQRRLVVASLLAQGLSIRAIVQALPRLEDPQVNQETGKPWSHGTVVYDARYVLAQWDKEMAGTLDEHKRRQCAELREVKQSAWKVKDFRAVIRAINLEADIMGTKAPAKLDARTMGLMEHRGTIEVVAVDYRETVRPLAPLEIAETAENGNGRE